MTGKAAHRGTLPGLAPAGPVARRVWSVLSLASLLSVAGAGAQTDPSGAWRTWHTRHFRVHAVARNAALAERAAYEAERAYALLAEELVPPRGTIDLSLFDNVDFSNGFTTVFPSSRISVYLTPPAGDPILAPYDDWLRLAITHELTHVFHLDRTRGLWRVTQRILGRAPGSFPNQFQPSWVAEGLAEYYESRLTTSGRLRGGLQDQLLAAGAAGHWPRPGDATLLSPRWPGGLRPYTWGPGFFAFEARARGDSVIRGFVERTSKQLWPLVGSLVLLPFPAVSPAMRGAGGVSLDSAWRGVRTAWEPAARRTSGGTIVARGLRAEPRPQVSPDGRRLAYVEVDDRSDARLVVRDIATGRTVAAHRVNGDVAPWWRSDTLYAGQLEFTSPVEVRAALYRWVPGESWDRVPGSDRLARPFGPTSGPLAAVDLKAESRAVVALEGRARTPVPLPGGDAWGYLAASPDGTWLAGSRHAGGQWDMVVWKRASPGAARAVTDDGALDDDPAWTPDGDRLLFASERAGLPQVLAYTPASGMLVQVTDEPTGARQPAPAPDGSLFYATILWDGWAVVRAQPLELPAPSPRPRPVLNRDTITATAVHATGYRPWPALAPHFWLPAWDNQGSAGKFAGLVTAGSDPVGRTAYSAVLALAPANGRLEGRLDVVHRRWKGAGVGLSLEQTWEPENGRVIVRRSTGEDTLDVTFGVRKQTVSLGPSFYWRRWRALVTGTVRGEYQGDKVVVDRPSPISLVSPFTDFGGGVVSVAAQYASYPALAISPENGGAVGALYRYRTQLRGTGWWSEARGSVSAYLGLPLPGFAHWVLAAHGAVGIRSGPAADGYDLGGVSGAPVHIVSGYAAGPGFRVFSLRGYPARGTPFTRAATAAVEFRVPLALVAKAVWKLPMGLDRVSVTGFAEGGRGWLVLPPPGGSACAVVFPGGELNACTLRDVGGELVLDGAIPQDARLRARFGVGVPVTAGLYASRGVARWYLAFGAAF